MESSTPATSVQEPMAYISRASCGCIRMATVDAPDRTQNTAREIARAVRNGETVERVTCDFVRTTAWTAEGCDVHEGPLAQAKKKPAAPKQRAS